MEFSSKRGRKNINGVPRLASERLYGNLARVRKNGKWLQTQNVLKKANEESEFLGWLFSGFVSDQIKINDERHNERKIERC